MASFEAGFTVEFTAFVESVLGAAAISIAFPSARTKSLNGVLVELRGKLRAVYGTIGEFIAHLAKNAPQMRGVMITSNERSIAAPRKFREDVKFGERLLLESEKLFNTKR